MSSATCSIMPMRALFCTRKFMKHPLIFNRHYYNSEHFKGLSECERLVLFFYDFHQLAVKCFINSIINQNGKAILSMT